MRVNHVHSVTYGARRARPGRRPLVIVDLGDLAGPATGTVELPLRLFWCADRSFNLSYESERLWVYQTVLREASRPEDLTGFLNRDLLVALWPRLYLPAAVREAWEAAHPELHSPTIGAVR